MSSKNTPIPFSNISTFAWSYLKDSPFRLFLALIGLIGSALCDLLTPLIAGELVDFLTENAANPEAAIDGAIFYIGLYVGIGIAYWICRHSSWFVWARLVAQAMKHMAQDVLYRVQRFSTDWHESSYAGATVTKIKRGMRGLQTFIDLFYYNFTPLVVVILGMIIIMTLKFAALGIIVSIGSLIYAGISIFLSLRYVMPASTEENRHDSLAGASLADTISCNATVKSFAQEHREDQRFGGVMRNFEKASLNAWFRSQYTNIVQNSIMTIYKIVFLGFSIWLWIKGIFSVGDVVFIIASYRMIAGYLRQVGEQIRRLQMAASDMEDTVKFSQKAFGVADKAKAKAMKVKKGLIEFQNVTFSYNQRSRPVFEDFSITIKESEKIALVGHSGSGKTTFVKLLQRLYDLQRGKILVDEQNIADLTLRSLRENIVLVPQEPILFHRSLAENITYGNPKASEKQLLEASKLAHAHEFISQMPDGYDTLVGERGIKLSGGERQRVAIARAMISKAPILILDEATSSLDSISEHFIQEAMERLMHNRTTIVIAHRLSTIKKVDRILVFEQGRIVEEGPHKKLIEHNGLYHSLYRMQAGGFIGA